MLHEMVTAGKHFGALWNFAVEFLFGVDGCLVSVQVGNTSKRACSAVGLVARVLTLARYGRRGRFVRWKWFCEGGRRYITGRRVGLGIHSIAIVLGTFDQWRCSGDGCIGRCCHGVGGSSRIGVGRGIYIFLYSRKSCIVGRPSFVFTSCRRWRRLRIVWSWRIRGICRGGVEWAGIRLRIRRHMWQVV